MNNTKNIIMIASITAVLGFGIAALQTNTITVDALMDNTSEFLDIGEKSEITTLAKPSGGGKKTALEGKGLSDDLQTEVKCSASRLFSCNIKDSGFGITKVTLSVDGINCTSKDVKDGASRASVNNRKSPTECDYTPNVVYMLEVGLNSPICCETKYFLISTAPDGTKLVIVPTSPLGSF